jgi:hypothetical protein
VTENKFIEFKSGFHEEAMEALSAFANTKGGKVVVGVNNQGIPIKNFEIGAEIIQKWLNDFFNEPEAAQENMQVSTPVNEQVEVQVEQSHKDDNEYGSVVDTPVNEQVGVQVGVQVEKLLLCMDHDFFSTKAVQLRLGLKQRHKVFTNYIQPAIKLGLIEMTIPDKPTSRLQKYHLTQKGKELKATLK